MPSSACQTSARSEEHTSELQSHDNLVCRLLLEKKKPHALTPQPGRLEARDAAAESETHCSAFSPPSCGSSGPLCPCSDAFPAFFFFFYGSGAPGILPFSPTGRFPV